MKKRVRINLLIVGVTTTVVSALLGYNFPAMYIGVVIGLSTIWGALPNNDAKRKSKTRDDKIEDLSFDGTTTQTGMSM